MRPPIENADVLATKVIATGSAATIAAFGLTWWAVAAAITGAFASYHFEPEQRPKGLGKLLFGIFAMGFVAALLSSAVPKVPMFAWTGEIPVEVRAGLLGVSIRFLYEQGRRLAQGYKKTGGT